MNTNETSMFDLQVELEAEMRGRGVEKVRKMAENAVTKEAESNTPYGSALIAKAIEPVAKAIEEFIKGSGKPGRRHIAGKYLAMLDPKVSAFLALKRVLDGITQRRTLQNVAEILGSIVEDEVKYDLFAKADRKKFARTVSDVSDSSSRRYKDVVVTHRMNKLGIEFEKWPASDRLHVGMKLIDIVIEVTGYAEVFSVTRSKGDVRSPKSVNGKTVFVDVYKLVGTAKLREWIDGKLARTELLSPEYMPCVVPPKPWDGVTAGGYHTENMPQLKLVKTRMKSYLSEMEDRKHEMPAVYEAVNAMQNTAWKINRKVYDVMAQAWDSHLTIAGLPQQDAEHRPPCPVCGSLIDHEIEAGQKHHCFEDEANKESHKAWKHKAHLTHERNCKRMSRWLQTHKVLRVAERYLEFPEVYFPYQLDFRGRAYAVPMFLQPQGDDKAKGLLTFARGKAIETDEAEAWLCIHGANVFGYDKVSLADRVAWVGLNETKILDCAEDPLGNLWWTEADKPWQFLAFCFEWAEYREHGRGYVSYLPVGMDGSCNGLQLFSLMLRDPIGAEATNCIPSKDGRPKDIYQLVADKVKAKLNILLAEGIEKVTEDGRIAWDEKVMACKWLDFGINRKTTKRQVMVLPYGGTQNSCREYTLVHLQERIEEGDRGSWNEGEEFKAAAFLSPLIWEAIGETVVAARRAMEWLQKLARLASAQGLPINWTVPTGFRVLQAYPNMDNRRVKTRLGDSIVYVSMAEEKDGLDKRRQANGISPNFVHSLDAAAMMLTISKALKLGVESFHMVHDCYGVPAADAEVMSRTLREVFVELFEKHDVLAEFLAELEPLFEDGAKEKIPPMPEKGNLELALVKDSPYFFA